MHGEDRFETRPIHVEKGVAEHVAGHGLGNVFHSFAAVRFDPLPLARHLMHAHVGEGATFVFRPDTRRGVEESAV